MMNRARAVVLLLACVAAFSAAARKAVQPRFPVEVAIEHVRVLPMDAADRVLENRTVIIRGDRIVTIGPAAEVAAAPGAMRIDGRGATLVPGLVDFHVHLYDEADLVNYVAHGVTSVVDLSGSSRTRAWRARVRDSDAPAPAVYATGPALNGYPPGNPSFVSLNDPDLAALEIRRQKALGYDLVKAYSLLPPAVYQSVLQTADEVGLTVVGHIPLQVGLDSALAAGQSMIAHGEEFWKVLQGADSTQLAAAVEAVRGAGVWVTPNLSALERIVEEISDLPAVMDDPEAAFVPPSAFSEWIPSNNRYWGRDTSSSLPEMRAEQEFVRDVTARLSAAGVPLLLGTDSPVVGFAGASAHRELALLVEAGLDPYEALSAATRSAGDFAFEKMGIPQRFGRIEPGYRADLLLVEGDPLRDVGALADIRGVMVRGNWHTAGDLASRRRAKSEREQPLRERVQAIDSLMRHGSAPQALDLYERTRVEHPDARPVAEIVFWSWGRRALRDASEDSESVPTARRLFEAMVRAYPDSHAGLVGIADAALAAGDTADAAEALSLALELSPSDAGVRERIARLELAGLEPAFTVRGVYELHTRANVGGGYRDVEMILTLEGSGPEWSGRIETDTPLPAFEIGTVQAGGNRLWVSAPLDGRSLDLRLTVEGDDVSGSWNLGASEQGILRGRRSAEE